jgi:hypothetical protein
VSAYARRPVQPEHHAGQRRPARSAFPNGHPERSQASHTSATGAVMRPATLRRYAEESRLPQRGNPPTRNANMAFLPANPMTFNPAITITGTSTAQRTCERRAAQTDSAEELVRRSQGRQAGHEAQPMKDMRANPPLCGDGSSVPLMTRPIQIWLICVPACAARGQEWCSVRACGGWRPGHLAARSWSAVVITPGPSRRLAPGGRGTARIPAVPGRAASRGPSPPRVQG